MFYEYHTKIKKVMALETMLLKRNRTGREMLFVNKILEKALVSPLKLTVRMKTFANYIFPVTIRFLFLLEL